MSLAIQMARLFRWSVLGLAFVILATASEDHVVLVSHALREARFAPEPAILERDIVINGEAHAVVGVLPKGGPFDRAATCRGPVVLSNEDVPRLPACHQDLP